MINFETSEAIQIVWKDLKVVIKGGVNRSNQTSNNIDMVYRLPLASIIEKVNEVSDHLNVSNYNLFILWIIVSLVNDKLKN